MKPRNSYEREVFQLAQTLKIRKSDMDWIAKVQNPKQSEYYAIYEAKGNWQVIRMFMYRRYTNHYQRFAEVLRYWIKNDGHYVIECKNRCCLGNYCLDPWSFDSELCIRSNNSSRDVRDLNTNYTRIHSLIPELKRTNFKANNIMVKNFKPFWLVHTLLTNNRVETFFKLRQVWLTWKFYFYDTAKLTEDMWQSIRIALRHGYYWENQQEINDWCDLIYDLKKLGLDTRNPHYICPVNIEVSHQHYINMLEKKRNEENWMSEIKEAEKYEPTFYATREQFLDMVLTDGEIVIKAIPTAIGIKEEGKAMHHCVGNYFNHKESLILSARINDKRVETIEVNLSSYELVQSRGLQNCSTPYHDRIVTLIEDNLDLIRVLNVNHKDVEKKKLRLLKAA